MANESTSTSWTSRILTEAIGPVAMPAHNPKNVIQNLINQDSIDGLPTLTKQFTQEADIGAASGLTEGTDLTTNTELTYETAVTVTPTESGLKSTLTSRAIRRAMPGASANAVADAIRSGDLARFVSLVAGPARRLAAAVDEKVEDDLANLLSTGSNTVGSTGVDLTVAVGINAQYTLKTLEPDHEDFAFILTPNQIQEWQLAQAAGTGGALSTVWFNQGDLSYFNHNPDASRSGFRGSFMGVGVYEYSHSIRTLMNTNADVAGALVLRGNPMQAPDEPGAQVGFAVLVEGHGLMFDYEADASLRAVELVAVKEYGVAEIDDSNIVTIVSDAP